MIYPSQERQIKDFLDELLSKYNSELYRTRHDEDRTINLDCSYLERLMERAKNLRAQLDLWTMIPEKGAARVEV